LYTKFSEFLEAYPGQLTNRFFKDQLKELLLKGCPRCKNAADYKALVWLLYVLSRAKHPELHGELEPDVRAAVEQLALRLMALANSPDAAVRAVATLVKEFTANPFSEASLLLPAAALHMERHTCTAMPS
jgi:hypothetical protein